MHPASHKTFPGHGAIDSRPGGVMGYAFPARSLAVLVPLWLLFATSSFVMVEPAPFDLLAFALCVYFAATGLRLVTGLQVPMIFAALFLLAHAGSIDCAPLPADPKRIVPVIWNGWIVAAVIAASLFCVGVFVLLLIGILLGFSRGAWGNLVASMLVFAVLAVLNARKLSDYMNLLWAGSSLVAVSVAVLVLAISNPHVGEMFQRRASLLQSYDVQAGGRFHTQSAALQVVAKSPLGIGPNQTKPFLDRNPHNVYIKIFAENGWLGGIAFLSFLGITLWRGFFFCIRPGPLQREAVVVFSCTLGIAAESVIIDTLHWRHYFVLLGMLWGLMLAGTLKRNTTTRRATAP